MMAMTGQSRVWRATETNPVKRYLMEYRVLVSRRDALLAELEHLREAATRATGRMAAVRLSGTPNHGGNEDAILRVVDGEARLRTVIDHVCEALVVRLSVIELLADERHKTLLTLRYVRGLSWEQIGYEMHYERTQVFEIHGQALREAQEAMAQGQRPQTDSAAAGV
jgi:DNA-directed RNA polymerase specialized sigma subunit